MNPLIFDEDLPQALPSKCTNHLHFHIPYNAHPALQKVLTDFKKLFSPQIGCTTITQHQAMHKQLKSHLDPSLFTLLIKFNFSLKTLYKRESFDLVVANGVPQQFMYLSQMGRYAFVWTLSNLTVSWRKICIQFPGQTDPHQRLAEKQIFSNLDLKSAYWQFPMDESRVEKTAFSSKPGYGLWEFVVCCMD